MEPTAHIVGLAVQVGSVRRQRCSWCGALLVEDDLARMSWTLNPDGSDPGPPPAWEVGAVVAVTGNFGGGGIHDVGFSFMRVVPEEEWPLSEEPGAPDGAKRLPDNCCAAIDVEVTR